MGQLISTDGTLKVKNYAYNGLMEMAFRGTAFTNSGNIYTLDRWFRFKQGGGNTAVNTSQVSIAGLIPGAQFALRMQRASGDTQAVEHDIIQALETSDSVLLQGKTATFSFWARAGANFSGTGLSYFLEYSTGSDQGVVASWTGAVVTALTSNITTNFQRYQVTVNIPTNATQIRFDINYTTSGTAGANDYVDIAGVMLTEGNTVPVNVDRKGIDFAHELSLCRRYYQNNYPNGTTPGSSISSSACQMFSTTTGFGSNRYAPLGPLFTTPMRTAPTVVFWHAGGTINSMQDYSGGTLRTVTSLGGVGSHTVLYINCSSAGTEPVMAMWTADAEL